MPDSDRAGGAAVDEQAVVNYLRRHPTFFDDKPSLLTDLRIPHHTRGAVSLVERQVVALRDTTARQQKQLDSLIQIARENDRLNEQLHRLILGILSCGNLADLLDLVHTRLREDFSADLVALRLVCPPRQARPVQREEFVTDSAAFRARFQPVLAAGKPYCGRPRREQLETLFGAQLASAVGSLALLPLGERGAIGLTAICSYEMSRFQPGVDTAFLGRMAEVFSAALTPHLQLPA
jgi:uncharacterized protein YigA (DUF484 family)